MKLYDKVYIDNLNPGDVFTLELRLKGRTSFTVLDNDPDKETVLVKDNSTGREINKRQGAVVTFLRHDKDFYKIKAK